MFVAVVCVALVTNGLFEIWVSYQQHKDALIQIQREQAEFAATKIGQFIKEIESQVGWTTQLLWSVETIEQRRFDALRLLRQVPAITELSQVDASGKEQLRVSRLAMDVVGSGLDLSKEPKFAEAVKNKVYYGPVYFRRESEPYMTLSLAGTRRDAGVSIAGSQSQAHLGRRLQDQGWRARPGLCGGCTRAADRSSGHQSGPPQYGHDASCPGAGDTACSGRQTGSGYSGCD